MTVEQLIKVLENLPGDTEVWLSDEHGDPCWQMVHDDVAFRDGKLLIETY